MMNLSKIGKNLALPIITLLVIFLAAGSVVTVATTSTATSSGMTIILAHPEPAPVLAAFCTQFWGEISEDASHCRFEQTFHINLAHAGNSVFQTAIPIFKSDIVTVKALNPPEVFVASRSQGAQKSFASTDDGYLAFRGANGQKFFSVQQVRVERCFGVNAKDSLQLVPCPVLSQ